MKNVFTIMEELAVVHRKWDIKMLENEKRYYAVCRDHKIQAIEEARACKKLGLLEYQLRWQHRAARYDKEAKESKQRIRALGAEIYK